MFSVGDKVQVASPITYYGEVTFLRYETISWVGEILAVHTQINKFHEGIVYCVKLEHPNFPGLDFEVLIPAYNTKAAPSGYPYENFVKVQ